MDEIEQTTQPQSPSPLPVNTGSNKRRKKILLILGVVFLIISLIVLSVFLFFRYFYNAPPKGIFADLDGQVATQNEFDEIYSAYLKFDLSNTRDVNSVDKKQIEKKVADEVLLRLALQAEAKKRNVKECSQATVDSQLESRYALNQGKKNYFASLAAQYGWTENVSRHKECLEYYDKQLSKSLISGVDLFGIYIRWDIANGQPEDVKKQVDEYAKKRLETEYLPMFEKGDTVEQLRSKADINASTPVNEFDKKVTNLEKSPSRTLVLPGMNKYQYSSFQQYDEGESEVPYFENLKVGQNTKPFKSKTGYWVIYRATARTDAPYQNLNELRDYYIKNGKVSKSYFSLPAIAKPQTNEGIRLNKQTKSPTEKLISKLIPTIYAGSNNIVCFSGTHALPFSLQYRDLDTGLNIPGTYYPGLSISSTGDVQSNCNDEPDPAAFAQFGVQITYSGSGQITYKPAVTPAPVWNFYLSCYTAWRFNFPAPDGYSSLSAADYSDRSRFWLSVTNSSGQSAYADYIASQESGQFRIPDAQYANVANGAKGFDLTAYFKKTTRYIGTLSTQKYPDGHGYGIDNNIPAAVNNATVRYSNSGGEFSSGDSNPFSQPLWVNSGTPYENFANFPGYTVKVDAPAGYKVKRWEIQSQPGGRYPNRYGGEYDAATGVTQIYMTDGNITWLDFFYEKLPDGNLEGLTCDNNTRKFTLSGWAMDLSRSSQAIKVAVYDGTATGPTNLIGEYLADGRGRGNESFSGVSLDGHLFNAELPIAYSTGNHTFYVYALGIDVAGNRDNNNVFIGAKSARACATPYVGQLVTKKFFPANHSTNLNDPPSIPAVISNAKVTYANAGGWFTEGAANPYSFSLWVNPFDQYSNVQGPYTATVEVPTGYRVARYELVSLDPASPYYGRKVYNTSDSTVTNIRMNANIDKNINSNVYLDFFFELTPPPAAVFYPWLQTQKGDVTSVNGTIWGQELGLPGSTDSNPGARRKNSVTPAEADYIIASSVYHASSGKNFCSNYLYVLGQNLDRRQDCKTGGYSSKPIDFNQVKTTLQNVWDKNGAGISPGADICKPYATRSANPTDPTASNVLTFSQAVNLGCTSGGYAGLQKSSLATPVSLGTPGASIAVSGRGTLWVTGDLTINADIRYGAAGNEPDKMPNLVIFVEGDVKIDERVTQIDASIISLKSINSCVIQPGTLSQNCSRALLNNGYWASDNRSSPGAAGSPIRFSRRYYNVANANSSPAELLKLTGQSIIFPPPGLNKGDGNIDSQLQIDPTELQPRLN